MRWCRVYRVAVSIRNGATYWCGVWSVMLHPTNALCGYVGRDGRVGVVVVSFVHWGGDAGGVVGGARARSCGRGRRRGVWSVGAVVVDSGWLGFVGWRR